jgi:hypothetical protein
MSQGFAKSFAQDSGQPAPARIFSAHTAQACPIDSRRPVLSLRILESAEDAPVVLTPEVVSGLAMGDNVLVELVANGTLNGASWISKAGERSRAEWDHAATSITGGNTVFVVYWKEGEPPSPVFFGGVIPTRLSSQADLFSVVATPLGKHKAHVNAGLAWKEI